MQIHEIFRRRTNEGILKGVANNVGTTLKGAGQGLGMAAAGVGKAGLNTAEYFANKILNAAGVPADQQGQYSKYGHIAAGLGQGTDSIARQEQKIANELAQEWARSGTLNGTRADTLDPETIKSAALQTNAAQGNLAIDANNVIEIVQKLGPQYVKDFQQQQFAKAQNNIKFNNLKQILQKTYNISHDPAEPLVNKQQAIALKNQVIDALKKIGHQVDQKYLDDTVAAAQNAVVQSAGAQALAPATAAKAPATAAPAKAPAAPAASPTGFNYNNMMKMPGMSQPVKPAVKKPAPAMAESMTWSKDFDPSEQLYRRMKQGQAQ